MQTYKSILVVHPGAIGDVVMGTPVPHTLKDNFPAAKILYLTHPSLFPLLQLSGVIDGFVEWNRQLHVLEMGRLLRGYKPELVIDLVGSARTRIVSFLSGARTLTYRKQRDSRTWSHVVDNYLATIEDLQLTARTPLFPTITTPSLLLGQVALKTNRADGQMLIALVPGVGKHRPNRAWPAANWVGLARSLADRYNSKAVLVGGVDDMEVCTQVADGLAPYIDCVNLAGGMTLPETAAVLQMCDAIVSADTGPAHIGAALGKQVVCLMGPTDPLRTGPYRMEKLGVYVGPACRCQKAKHCLVPGATTYGECLKAISLDMVLDKVASMVPALNAKPGA